MDFNRLFPKSSKKNTDNSLIDIYYLFMIDLKWSYKDFCNTPAWLIIILMKKHKKVIQRRNKKK